MSFHNLIQYEGTNNLTSYDNLICPYKNYTQYSTVDLDELLRYKHWINGWLSALVIGVGILANFVTIFAFSHKNMRKSSTNIYLMALSVSNMFSLICLLLMSGLRFTLVYPYR